MTSSKSLTLILLGALLVQAAVAVDSRIIRSVSEQIYTAVPGPTTVIPPVTTVVPPVTTVVPPVTTVVPPVTTVVPPVTTVVPPVTTVVPPVTTVVPPVTTVVPPVTTTLPDDDCNFVDITKCAGYDAPGWTSTAWKQGDDLPKPTNGNGNYIAFKVTKDSVSKSMTIDIKNSPYKGVTASVFFTLAKTLTSTPNVDDDAPIARLFDSKVVWLLRKSDLHGNGWIQKVGQLDGKGTKLSFNVMSDAVGVIDTIAFDKIDITDYPATTIAPPPTVAPPTTPRTVSTTKASARSNTYSVFGMIVSTTLYILLK